MKNLTLYVAALAAGLLTTSAARATDLPKLAVKAAPVARAADWTGFYAGIQAGGGTGHAGQTDGSPFDSGPYNLSGGIVGVTWGYNWQLGNTVVGFESDAAWSNIRGATDGSTGFNGPCGGTSAHCEAKLQAFGTNRLRLGYAMGRWLPYVAGGMAWGRVYGKEGDTVANGASGSGAEFHYGWTAGGGLEAMLDPHWSAKVEYLYADLRGGGTFTDDFLGGGSAIQSVSMQVHIVRAGLNYKFNPGHSLLSFTPPSPGPSPGPSAGPWNWAGLYAGLNYGGGAGKASQSDSLFDRGSFDVGGSVIGGTLGYNWQRDRWVYGLEGDLDYSSIKGSTSGSGLTVPPCGALSSFGNCDVKLQWLGTARARVGVAWDRLLPYVTGGVAVGSLKSSEGDLQSTFLTGSGTMTRVGWTAGAGIEARIDKGWSSKFEYLYVDLGSGNNFTENSPLGGTLTESVSFKTHILRAGMNYRFN